MFGIGGGELLFILFMILMFFGSDKIPEMARTFGKFMAQVRNATNDIKSEIHNSGVDMNTLTGGISDEVAKAKEGFTQMLEGAQKDAGLQDELHKVSEALTRADAEISESVSNAVQQLPEDYTGPIKRTR